MKISTSAFDYGKAIPREYTCDGINAVIPFQIDAVSSRAKSLVLIMDDPDAPRGTFTHWLLYNIPPETSEIVDGLPTGMESGLNGSGRVGYASPCPPSGTHRYFFKLYALDTLLSFSSPPTRSELDEEMRGHLIDSAEIISTYTRS